MFEKEVDQMKKKLAKKIREVRMERRLTQGDLAEKMGVSQPFISKIEKGESLPEPKTLNRLAEALDVDEDYFVEQISTSSEETAGANKSDEILNRLKQIESIVKSKYDSGSLQPLSVFSSDEKEKVKEVEIPVGAGECFTEDTIVGEHVLPRSLTYGATHMLKVSGQSMEPYVMDQDLLLVVPQYTIEHDGQMAIINIGSQVNSVKFVYVRNDLVGIGRSRKEAKWYPRDEIHIQGIVVGKISPLNVITECETQAKYRPE